MDNYFNNSNAPKNESYDNVQKMHNDTNRVLFGNQPMDIERDALGNWKVT